LNKVLCNVKLVSFSAAQSNPNGLQSQNLNHHLNQGRTLKDVLMEDAH